MAQEAAGSKTAASMAAAGTGLGHIARALTGRDSRRFFSGLLAGGGSFVGHLGRVAKALFLQVTGFFFLVISAGLGTKAWREYHVYVAQHTSPSRFYLATFFFVLFLYFGLSSFWRARK